MAASTLFNVAGKNVLVTGGSRGKIQRLYKSKIGGVRAFNNNIMLSAHQKLLRVKGRCTKVKVSLERE